jgi:hypothetical protein
VTTDELLLAAKDAISRSGGAEVIYLHGDPSGPAFAAIVVAGTTAYGDLHAAEERREHGMHPHDHVEPGEWIWGEGEGEDEQIADVVRERDAADTGERLTLTELAKAADVLLPLQRRCPDCDELVDGLHCRCTRR